MKKCFKFFDLPESLKVQFLRAHQSVGEKLEDWADRFLSLATKSFCNLPKNHAYSQDILRLCQGCCDKEAGQQPCHGHLLLESESGRDYISQIQMNKSMRDQ